MRHRLLIAKPYPRILRPALHGSHRHPRRDSDSRSAKVYPQAPAKRIKMTLIFQPGLIAGQK
jgi:hypothetical protein